MQAINDNKQLAGEYFKCVSRCASDWRSYLAIRKAIAESAIDLCKHFATKGSLRGCKVAGVGLKTRRILEQILRDGSKVVSEAIIQQRENDIRPRPGADVPSGIPDNLEVSGSADNAIRAIEENSD